MDKKLRVAILDDHPAVIDGYTFRLETDPGIQVVGWAGLGDDLEPMLLKSTPDVLILDVKVPISHENVNPYPILIVIPMLIDRYPGINILVISMLSQRSLIKAILDAGASGYILKDDWVAMRDLASIVRMVASGSIYLAQTLYHELLKRPTGQLLGQKLAPRQLEVLSLCSAYPDSSTYELAVKMGVAHSTVRNLLSGAYLKLDVRNRTAAVVKARQMGLITPEDERFVF
jgi:two-component system nitrate/nitrite response regulator NarL